MKTEGSTWQELTLGEVMEAVKTTEDLAGWDGAVVYDWISGLPPSVPDKLLRLLMLITTEVAEAAEAVRNNDLENFREELADIVIRVFTLAQGLGVDLAWEIEKKNARNRERVHKHGGKLV